VIALVDREPLNDERGRGESLADATDERAKVIPVHVGNISLAGQRGESVISTETVGHIDRESPMEIEERQEG
jgi:hypothetical protein